MIKKIFYGLIILTLLTACQSESKKTKDNQKIKAVNISFEPSDSTWRNLSLREKIGQVMVIRACYDTHIKQFGSIENMMQKYPVGGIFLPDWTFLNIRPQDSIVSRLKKIIQSYESVSQYPLIITEDFERGVGNTYKGYTHFPAEMSLGAANNPQLSYRYGNAISKEAKSLGFNWLLHPVADLNLNPLQNLVVERAVSDDAQLAYPLLKAQMDGMKKNGVVATVKHFPGDGATMKNQHFVTSANNLSRKKWNESFGTMYQKLINDSVPCIMVGHIRFPAYQKEKLKGVLPPATLSKELLVNLLKKQMKFNGVVMSDALNMGGAAGYYPDELETAVKAFEAGVDLVLWPGLQFMDTVEARIKRGEIPMSRLNDAVKRVWSIKEKYGLLKKKQKLFQPLTPEEKNEIKQTGTDIAQNAVTLLADEYHELPLKPEKIKKLAIVNLSHYNLLDKFAYTKELLEKKGFVVDTMLHNPSFFEWGVKLDYFKQFDKILVVFENHYFSPLGSAFLKDQEALGLWTMGMIPQEKIIAISYSNPYYVNYYFDHASIRINAYSLDDFTQKAVVDALTGTIPFKGKSPVQLEFEFMK